MNDLNLIANSSYQNHIISQSSKEVNIYFDIYENYAQ